MALMVGDLAATLRVDDRQMGAGLRRGEGQMRASGARIAADAGRAGDRAGRQLGDGLADGAADGADRAGGRITSAFRGFGAALLGLSIGGALMSGLGDALEQGKIPGRLEAQLGPGTAIAAQSGRVAGDLYAGAITDSVEDAADILRGIAQSGLLPPEATEAQMRDMGRRVADTAAVMGEDVSAVSRAVGQMMRTGVADSAEQAMDILVRGTQNGNNAAGDLLDTFTEYSTQFRSLGLDGATSLSLIQQGLQGGARDADVVADAIKEFAIEAVAGGDKVRDGFEALDLDADALFEAIGTGGEGARDAFTTVLDTLRDVEDATERNEIATDLFGTKAEDLAAALYSLDPASAVDALGDVKGAVDDAGDAMRDNAATKIEVFKRGLTQGVVNVLGTQVIPAFERAGRFIRDHGTELKVAAGIITAVLLPALIRSGIQATITGTQVVAAWVMMGIQSMLNAAKMAAAWLIAMGPVGLIIAAVVGLVALIIANWETVKEWTIKIWDWLWQKLKWVAEKVVDIFLNFTLVGLIIKHWSTIKTKTTEIWNNVVDWIKKIPGRIVDFFLNWTLVGRIIRHWSDIKDGTKRKAEEMLDFVKGIPRTIVDYFADLRADMTDKGKDIARGIWDGIKGMGTWLKNQVTSWAKQYIPGPIASVLGINSPSRVMRDEVGRWIPAGVAAGIEAGAPAVERSMQSLVRVDRRAVLDGPGTAPAASSAPPSAFAAGASGGGVHIEHWHAGDATADQLAAALDWQARGRG
ncbi:phage tail tape measure protein [Streptomyces carpaticus]|uniref:phage tail tape measure protein n=1 Tax=Streptomyces carpaticus TaxID=285558 RepID=UPI00220778CD|nr:phage tail tape measure protein [Streptomyces carpaticus]